MTSSMMYAEFVACYEATWQTMWLKKFVQGLRVVYSIERLLKLYCDNKSAVLYTHNNKKIKDVKHINIMFYIVKEKIQNQTISLEHISTKKMITDSLMKGLPPSVVREYLAGMSLREAYDSGCKGPRQESALKQKGVSWSVSLIVRNWSS
jgi:hypothetical protein